MPDQAIDGHVEQLAGGVAGLLGGFLGTARTAGTQVAGRLEAGLEVSDATSASCIHWEGSGEEALQRNSSNV